MVDTVHNDTLGDLASQFSSLTIGKDSNEEEYDNVYLDGISGAKWAKSSFISSGGMAGVYNVISIEDSAKYPAKYILKRGKNISSEIRLYTKLYNKPDQSPYLPRYIDSGVSNKSETPFLILPKYNQPLTKKYFSAIPDKMFLKMVNYVVLGLKYLHENGFCHNDVKPDNVLYDPETDCFLLLDFSITSKWNSLGNLDYNIQRFSGTKIYTGLDMHVNGGGPSPRSDIDSLIFTMLDWAGLTFSWRNLKNLDYIHKQKLKFLENPSVLLDECKSSVKKTVLQELIDINRLTSFAQIPDYTQIFESLDRVLESIPNCCETCDKLDSVRYNLLGNFEDKKNKAALEALKYMELL